MPLAPKLASADLQAAAQAPAQFCNAWPCSSGLGEQFKLATLWSQKINSKPPRSTKRDQLIRSRQLYLRQPSVSRWREGIGKEKGKPYKLPNPERVERIVPHEKKVVAALRELERHQ
jgi:hypothetical protein